MCVCLYLQHFLPLHGQAQRGVPAVTVPSATKAESSTENAKSLQFYHEGLKKWNADDPQGAIDCYFKSIEEKPSSDAYYNIGNCYLQLGDHEAAALAWAQSIELAPDRSDARVNLGNVYAMVLKETDKALPQLAEAVRLDPEDGEIQYNYAAMLDSAGQLDKAVEHYKLAVKLGVPRAEKNLRNALARLLAEQTAKGI
ncbi:hypothetical protein HKX48_004475 [Thoreauomyces humboldtii]|nr:hypothetical protein HKX48_004475 [Thoreauomyces humboldtii]